MEKQTIQSENELHLSGGIFFTVLVIARIDCFDRPRKITSYNRSYTDPEMLAALTRLVTPKFTVTDAKCYGPTVSNYKRCKQSSGKMLPFTLEKCKSRFNTDIQSNYAQYYAQMTQFVDTFIPEEAGTKAENSIRITVIRTLNTIILNDSEFDSESPLWIDPTGKTYSKSDLEKKKRFDFAAYLLGVWHYIVMHRKNNDIGKATYDCFFADQDEADFDFMPILNAGKIRPPAELKLMPSVPINSPKPQDGHSTTAEVAVDLSQFLQKMIDRYEATRTVLYRTKPRQLKDFHVINDIALNDDFDAYDDFEDIEGYDKFGDLENWEDIDDSDDSEIVDALDLGNLYLYQNMNEFLYFSKVTFFRCQHPDILQNATLDDLLERCDRLMILSGAGGNGKTMMMRRLFLDGAQKYLEAEDESLPIPIYVDLKALEKQRLEDYLCQLISISETELDVLLKQRNCCLILDGLEEVKAADVSTISNHLIKFSEDYDRPAMIISSRPVSQFMPYHRFHVLHLMPFTPIQAETLVQRTNVPKRVKEEFLRLMYSDLLYDYPSFVTNPMMLTIMVRIYANKCEIPSRLSDFYKEVYDTLVHWENPDNAARFRTGLGTDRFEEVFGELCYLATCRELKELTKATFRQLYNIMDTPKKYGFELKDFIDDCCVTTGLMTRNNTKYNFLHQMFREYFCALHVACQEDDVLEDFGKLLDRQGMQDPNDPILTILYEQNEVAVKRCIFLPQLKSFFSSDSERDNYQTYLLRNYPEIYCVSGEGMSCVKHPPQSLIVAFILENAEIPVTLGLKGLPFCAPFVLERLPASDDTSATSSDTQYLMKIPTDQVLKDPEKYDEMYTAIHDTDFPLYLEYCAVRDYYEGLEVRF